ncbi:unnamed protein product [Dracunculus medinensis]|uniref:G_PROTEIN_RECEP_F1_2 domain-containing protein n=1 Tax=Dracunculus medinensis TaxID=318479 RepID=A0A158Q5S3_DRAME|nr:unnamed protein product [Dracunculus medinensis]
MNYSQKCWSERHQILSGSVLEMIIFTLFFPPICIFGIVGNILNLMVLLSSQMKSRANTLLACLALCDIVFLILMIPHSLANFDIFAFNYYFRLYYLSARIHLITLANWTSAVAIWFTVCVERVMGIKYPFRTRSHWSRTIIALIIFLILLIAGILTFYNHFSHVCIIREFCNRTQVMAKCFDVTLDKFAFYIVKFVIRKELFVILIRKKTTHQRIEHRLAITVCAIVTCFTITQGPSAIVLSINSFSSKRTPHGHPEMGLNWYHLHTITSFLVIVGKALNFILFCFSSIHFRRQLIGILRAKLKGYTHKQASDISCRFFF